MTKLLCTIWISEVLVDVFVTNSNQREVKRENMYTAVVFSMHVHFLHTDKAETCLLCTSHVLCMYMYE